MATLAVIPARYGSSRLPGKPLASIGGEPLVRRVYEGVVGTGLFDDVVVATDDDRIARAVEAFGGVARRTRADHPSGTDRVAEVAAYSTAEIVANVQGDLPFVDRSLLADVLEAMRRDTSIPMGTVAVPIRDETRWMDPNVVKVVMDPSGFALYFSRAPIPARRGDVPASGDGSFGWQHVGIYVYRRSFLLELASWPTTPLEERERLEQLRVLERGGRIFVARAEGPVIEVDTPADLDRAQRLVAEGA